MDFSKKDGDWCDIFDGKWVWKGVNMEVESSGSNKCHVAETPKPQRIYRCRKCRRIVASEETIVAHERWKGEECFKWKKSSESGKQPDDCSSIFVEPMKWIKTVQEGFVGDKLQCFECKARLGSFNWAGMQCNCGTLVNPAFQLHKSRLDECHI